MSKEEENKENKNDDDDEKEKVSWYVAEQNKTTNIIKKYNIGTLQIFISPEILSMTSKERKRIDKIYYKRDYTSTPSELQKSQKDYEKEVALQKEQKEQKEQRDNIAKQAAVPPALPAIPPPPNVVPPAPPALPSPPRPVAPNAPNADLKKKQLMIGGGFFDSDFNDDRGRLYERERERERMDPYNGMEARMGARTTTSSSITASSLLSNATKDAEPFIASLVKFNNSGFPNNATIKARVDTFFNINLFKAFVKKLGEPIKLYGNDSQIVSVDDIEVLNEPKNQKKDDSKKKVFETDQKTEGSFITNWYPSQEQKKLIGSVYAFIYTTPTEQEKKQALEMSKKIPEASMLMIKEGDNYRLIGGPIDNREKVFAGYGVPLAPSPSSRIKSDTDENTVANQINSEYRKITGQSSLPMAVSNTGLRFIYEPQSSFDKDVNANSDKSKMKSVIYTRQVTNSQIESIIESSRASSTDIVKVPITTLFNIISGKTQTLQLRIDLNPNTVTILKFLFRILEKQNLLSAISGQQKKKTGEIYDDRIKAIREKLSESSLNELDAVIRHNIRFILDIIFSNKVTFNYKGIDYIIDYLEWNNTFKQLRKVLENYKVAYYIELELFLEKLEKGKLAIDRDRTLFSSCAVKGSQIKNFWRRNFLEQNWARVGRQIKNSIKVKSTPSVTDILPGFLKKALNVGGSEIMSQLNTGVNQISFVQYCLLGQEQLVQDFKNIDNSFAGVSWKNENLWSKRKEILFNAMDMCGSDIYCFQNVQCSLESYRKIVESLTGAEKETLQDVTTPNKQSERIKIHRKVLNQLLEKVDDPLNLLAQIYERYKQEYFFVYFFEQSYIGGAMTISDKKTALGNLTMVKSDKFELKDETDIRMGAFINKNKKSIENINSIEAIYSNTSFAIVTYCTFKGGVYTKPSSLPGQMPGSVISSPPFKTSATGASATSPAQADVTRSKLPGLPGYSGMIKISEADDSQIPDEGTEKDVEGINDYEEGEGQGQGQGQGQETKIASPPTISTGTKPVKVGGDGTDGQDGGGDGDGDAEWYNQDNSEQAGIFSGLFGNTAMGKQPKVKPEAEPCKKYMNMNYIPGGQIFGIINIKIETAETLKQIEAKQASTAMPVKFTKPTESTNDKKVTKQMLEVLLIAAFVSKFRVRYYLSSSTDINPYFMAGDFNFDIPHDQQISKSEISKVYSVAPALALLLTRSNNVFKPESYLLLAGYAGEINSFIKACKIVTYLYGGKDKNGRLRLNGYTSSQTLPNLFGHKYSLTNPEKINKSGLIFTTGKLLLCPKEEMKKIVNSDSTEGLPIYPNKSNPSNTEAVGGVFELDTAFVSEIIKQVSNSEVKEQQNQQVALQNEARRSLVEELSGRTIGRQESISPTQRMASSRPVEETKEPVKASVEADVETEPDEIPDWTQSTSGKPSTDSVILVPPAIQIAGEDLKKLNNYEYTASKAETVKGSPYKKSVVICETGKPDYNYLTSLEMSKWNKPENKYKIYSDHSPIMYNINNTNNSQCGPQLATSTSGQSAMSGGKGEGGYDNAAEMEGGAFPAEIKLITWNIASHGGEGKDKSSGALIYFHKFNGNSKEGIEHYKSRLANNARAIRAMMKGGYDYTLIQEGPASVLERALNREEAKASSTASPGKEGAVFQPFKYKEFLTTSIKNKEGSDGGDNLDIIPSIIDADDRRFGEFYLVVNTNTVNVKDIKSLGFLIKDKSGKKMFSNDEAAIIFNSIIQMVEQQNVPKYELTYITKDCLRLWFFINTKSKQILTSTHLSLSEENTPKMYERQRQIYILLNTVVSYFRQYPVYRDYDIVFSGDFNINLLQPFPTDVQPNFLKCTSVAGQQTFIYTSKNNAPSSFGGENEAKYNRTNIDFTVFYPKVVQSLASKTKKVGPSASLPEKTPSIIPLSSSGQQSVKVSKITYYIQNEIFKALQVTPPATNLLDKNVSVVNTDYSMTYAGSGIMPPGSATLLDIGNKPLSNIDYKHPTATPTTPSSVIVKYMIQASPAKAGAGDLITRYTLSNSVMNSLILASLNGVERIIFPFIGGKIFFEKLEAVELAAGRKHNKKEHAKMLLKGVTDFHQFMKDNKKTNTLKRIYFCPWGEEEVDALYSALYNAKSYVSSSGSGTSDSIKKMVDIDSVISISKGKSNLIEETINLAKRSTPVKIDAIVNAANVELGFGSGVSSMCYAAIGQDVTKQQKLDEIKKQFCDAFKKYIKQKNDDTLQVSSIATIAEKIRNNALLEMGVPRGYVVTSGDTHEVGIPQGEGNKIVNKRIGDLKLNNFEITKDSGKFMSGILAGSHLFYYDIKPKYAGTKYNYIKCWFPFNTSTFRTGLDDVNLLYKLQVYNPLGSDGMVVWLDTSTTAESFTPFGDNQKKEIKKAIDSSISQPETSYVDAVKYYINTVLDSYKNKSFYLRDEIKDKIIELAKQINMPVPDGIASWDDIKGWAADYVAPASAALSPSLLPSLSPSVSPVAPLPSSKKQPPPVPQIKGIKRRATVEEFKQAHANGIKKGDKIPGGVDDKIVYSLDGSNFDTALKEINDGQKKTDWMWYIFPSDLPTRTSCATFFRVGPACYDRISKGAIEISDYLKDAELMENYMTITEALYDKVEDIMDDYDDSDETPQNILRKIMNIDIDYLKLKKSIQNFYKPLKARINEKSSNGGTKFIKKMNILNYILNNVSDYEYRINDDKRVEINHGYFQLLDDESQETDSPESVESVTSTNSPSKESEERTDEERTDEERTDEERTDEESKEIGEGKESKEGKESEAVAIEDSKKDKKIESALKLEKTSKCRILTIEQILILMIKNIKDNVFIISGGSYNPPHKGHIKMFESAYNTRKSESGSDSGIKGYYGIMVVATRQHIMTKIKDEKEILYSHDRIKLCELACDTYSWENPEFNAPEFNANNMIILNVSDDNPVRTILYRIEMLIDTSSRFSEDEKIKVKVNNLLYLCGSDFFIKWYSESSRYSVICIVRKSEEGLIEDKMKKVDKYDNNPYLKEQISISDSKEYDLSSSAVRSNIYKLQTLRKDKKDIENIQGEIIKSIGLPVYCYLADLNYLVDKNYYGKKCELDSTIEDELGSLDDSIVSRDDGADADAGADAGAGDDEATARGYYLDYSSTGNIDDIPKKNRNIYIGINAKIVFDSRTIESASYFDNVMNQLVSCGIYDKKPSVDFKKMKAYLKRIYDERLYYILNDLCYFKDYKIGKQHCFIQDLLSNGDGNKNLLENMRLVTTQEFNREYLAETSESQSKIANLISSKDAYLSSIDADKYTDYSDKTIDKKMVDDILGFLYDSERYSLYLYLIDEEKSQPLKGKKIIASLYSIIINQKNDKVEYVFSKLTDDLTSTLMRSKDKPGKEVSKLMESLKSGAKGAAGPDQLLKAVKYVKQKSNCDGNCFYNSIGMLSSNYMVEQKKYKEYVEMSSKDQYEIQFKEQSRVRTELTEFLTKIYELIQGKVDMNTQQYKNSPILKYIIRKGAKEFKYVRKISRSVGDRYYGSDEEIYFASLLYLQPIITVIGISDITVFNIFYWETYSIKDKGENQVLFKEYIEKSKDEIGEDGIQGVINFLIEKNIQYSYDTAQTSKFLLDKPGSYFLVGGRGHWVYAVNEGLLKKESAGAVAVALSGGNASYNLRTTKKIKNKYYKKGSSSSSKTTKKHKKTRRANKNNDNKDNKGNNDNKLQNKKRIKKTIKQ